MPAASCAQLPFGETVLLIRSKNNAVHFFCHTGNGTREWSGNRCVFAIPRKFPLHSRSLTIPWWGGGVNHPNHDFYHQNGIFLPGVGVSVGHVFADCQVH